MSPKYLKRYNKTKVRHQRKELDERKKRISGLTLVHDTGQSIGQPERKGQTKATTCFTRAVREFGEQRCLFDKKAYATVLGKGKAHSTVTKGRLTVPSQGLFARGKISKPACREPLPGKRTKSRRECELHEIIRHAQNNPRGQQYQLQKQLDRERDLSPEVDNPDPEPSSDQHSFDEPSHSQDDRFSPKITSTKSPKAQQHFGAKPRPVRDESPTSTFTCDERQPQINLETSTTVREMLSPDSHVSDASVREMELEEQVVDGITKWVVEMRAALKFSKLEYLEETRQYLKDLHKETLRRELEESATSKMAKPSKPSTQTAKTILLSKTNAQQKLQVEKIVSSKTESQSRTKQTEIEPGTVERERLPRLPVLSNSVVQTERQCIDRKRAQRDQSPLALRPTGPLPLSADDGYSPIVGSHGVRRHDTTEIRDESRKQASHSGDNNVEEAETSEESFCFSPVVSAGVATDFATAFSSANVSREERDDQSSDSFDPEDNRRRLRGRERVVHYQMRAAEEYERLRQKKERDYRHEMYSYRKGVERSEIVNDVRFRGQSGDRMSHRVVGSPGRSSRSLERSYGVDVDRREWNRKEDARNCGKLREQHRECTRKFGGENRFRYSKEEIRRRDGYQRPWDGERKDEQRMDYRSRRDSEERNYWRSRDDDLRSPLKLPSWLLEKSPERVFRPRKMFD